MLVFISYVILKIKKKLTYQRSLFCYQPIETLLYICICMNQSCWCTSLHIAEMLRVDIHRNLSRFNMKEKNILLFLKIVLDEIKKGMIWLQSCWKMFLKAPLLKWVSPSHINIAKGGGVLFDSPLINWLGLIIFYRL